MQEFFGLPVISLTLVDPYFYHLDTALFVLDDGSDGAAGNVAYYPGAFSPGSREVLERLYPDAVIAAPARTPWRSGSTPSPTGGTCSSRPGARGLSDQLAGLGYVPVPVDLSEFHKAGGGIKCCTQEIREIHS